MPPDWTGSGVLVLTAGTAAELLGELAADVRDCGRDVGAALHLAGAWGARLPRPGGGETALLWEALATTASIDLQVARTLEPHLDAAAILAEHGEDHAATPLTWGVFAAEGPGVRLDARRHGERWVLDGTKPWCSLAARLDRALVTAWRGEERGLFAVDLHHAGVTATPAEAWVAHGLPDVVSTRVDLDGVPARPVGDAGWYLRRDGFAWGGLGVAAVWFGGAVGVARRLVRQSEQRRLDQVGLAHLGAVDRVLHGARAALAEAAADVDAGRATGSDGAHLALRVRGVVVAACEEVLRRADHALGPGPLVGEPAYAAAVADLHLYVRQHHAERDDAALGALLAGQGP